MIYCVEYDTIQDGKNVHKKIHVSAISKQDAQKIVEQRHHDWYDQIVGTHPPYMRKVKVYLDE